MAGVSPSSRRSEGSFMVECLECGNCRQGAAVYFCTARGEFVISEEQLVIERERPERKSSDKGNPRFSTRRRRGRERKAY